MGAADTANARTLTAAAAPAKPQGAPSPALPSQKGSAGLRIIKFFLALALIPACIGFTQGIHDYLLPTTARLNYAVFGPGTMLKWSAAGALCFGIMAILLWRPVVVYVFGHELAHAFATWLCLGKVTNLTASARGGQVTTSKTNTFIRLAPYFVPVYVVFAIALFTALDRWWQPLDRYLPWLAAVIGFFYAFHLGFTLWSLRRDQPDLQPDGWLFSLVLIYLMNLAVFALLAGFLCDNGLIGSWQALKHSARHGYDHTQHIYGNLRGTLDHWVNG